MDEPYKGKTKYKCFLRKPYFNVEDLNDRYHLSADMTFGHLPYIHFTHQYSDHNVTVAKHCQISIT